MKFYILPLAALAIPLVANPYTQFMVNLMLVYVLVAVGFNLVLGIITPPMGIGLFVTARIADMTPEEVLRGTLPFLIPLFLSLLLISFVPILSTWLPDLVFGP